MGEHLLLWGGPQDLREVGQEGRRLVDDAFTVRDVIYGYFRCAEHADGELCVVKIVLRGLMFVEHVFFCVGLIGKY